MEPRPGYRRGAPTYLGSQHMEPLHYGTTYSSVKDSSSWILWQGHENLPHSNKHGRLWSALLAFAVFVVILIVLAIAALAIYMGAMRLDSGKYLIFDGSLRVTYGDHYTSKLSNHSSKEYKEKSNKYKLMVENLYGRSELGPAVRYCSITGFANGSLVVFFRLILDRRKIPKKLTNVEETARMIIQEEANSLKPVALKNIRVDPKQIFIKRNMEQGISHMGEENETMKQNNITTEVRNGVIRRAQKHSTISPVKKEHNNRKEQPENVVKGSYRITSSEPDSGYRNTSQDISVTNPVNDINNYTSPLPINDNMRSSTSKSHSTKIKYSSPPPRQTTNHRREQTSVAISSTTPVTDVMNIHNMQHSPALTALISQKKDEEKTNHELLSNPTYEIRKEEIPPEPDLITLLPYILPVSEEPWKPILPDNFTRHPQRRPTVTEEYGFSSGIGIAEVILDPPDDETTSRQVETFTDYRNSNKKMSPSSVSLGQKTFEKYRHEGPRSSDKISTFQLYVKPDDSVLTDAAVLHTASGDIIHKLDSYSVSSVENSENITASPSSTSLSSVYPLPDYATLTRFHHLDSYLKSYNEMVSKHGDGRDNGGIKNTGRSSNANFNNRPINVTSPYEFKPRERSEKNEMSTSSFITTEYKSSEFPIVTLIPVRSNLGIGRPLRPRPKLTATTTDIVFLTTNHQPPLTSRSFQTPVLSTKPSNPLTFFPVDKKEVRESPENIQQAIKRNKTDEYNTPTESTSETTFVELITETESIPTATTSLMDNLSNSKQFEIEMATDTTIWNSEEVTITPDTIEETTVITNMFTTDTEFDSSKEFSNLADSSTNTKTQLRQAKMTVDPYNHTNQIKTSGTEQETKKFDEKFSTNILVKTEGNKTKATTEISEFKSVTSKKSYDVHLIHDDLFNNSSLPLNILLTALTPISLINTNNKTEPSKYNSMGNNIKKESIIKNTDILNNTKTIDVDSLQILLGNHTIIFPETNITHERNHSKNILNNASFKYLISPQYAKDKKIKSPNEEETPKSVSLSYTINNAGLSILTKTYNKVQSNKESEKEKISSTNLSYNITECKNNGTFQCKNGECVSGLSRCNQLVDCSDGTDEKNCSCVEFLQAQFLTRKICDGVVDCWDFSDENNCEWCTPGQYVCTDSRICINYNQVCDDIQDCPLGDDEKNCITIAPSTEQADDMTYHSKGYLMVRKEGEWGKLCLQNLKNATNFKTNWTIPDVGQEICKTMTYSDFEEIRKKQDIETYNQTSPSYFELTNFQNDNLFLDRSDLNFSKTECQSMEVVQISCKDLKCGMRPQANTKWSSSSNITSTARRGLRHSRIVGGGNASPGSWPWQAALYKEGEFQCGATLISDRWLLSAGHCFYHALEDYWVARLGALRRGTSLPSPYEQLRPVSRILLHPGYIDAGFINDISLLQMKTPVKFSNYVRPICLPSPSTPIKDGSMCTVVGWGQLFEVGRIFPDTLQEVQLPVISTTECRKRTLFLPLYRVTENMLCAGYDRGGRDACLGDSGGPLMCQETDGRWSLLGVTSNGYGCARANRPGVYTKVSNYLSWVQNNIANSELTLQTHQSHATCHGHRCPLGECLPLARVCNGYMECSDGSDEHNCW
ncbi:uncharacterized protein LOC142330835 [Lycorma delicatula]|uniref:uncharacterized protein LOC142330835 n=1 Tax=Lycorma delicatula TaxID=130591 RepID=UPI003F513F4F